MAPLSLLGNYRVRIALLSVIAVCLIEGCGGPDDEQTRGVFHHSLPGRATDLDPLHATDRLNGFLIQNVFETLYRYQYLARPYRLTPELADGLPVVSNDGLTVTIGIAQGHYFSDHPGFAGGRGRQVTAEDVAYSLRRHFDPALRSEGRWLWRDWLVPVDPNNHCAQICAQGETVVFRLRRPYPQLAATLATAFAAVVPREVVEHRAEEFGRAPVGSGPFRLDRLDEFVAHLVLNPNYHRPVFDPLIEGFNPSVHGAEIAALAGRPLPISQRIEVAFVADEASRMVAFDGDASLDMIRLPSSQVRNLLDTSGGRQPLPDPRLKAEYSERYNLSLAQELGFVRLDLNMVDPALGYGDSPQENLRNRQLRCAILSADSWPRRNQVLYSGMGRVFKGLVPPQVGSVVPNNPPPPAAFDGYFPKLNYGATAGPLGRREFDFFRTQMVQAGYPADQITFQTYATLGDLIRAIGALKVNVYLTGWSMDYPDPINNFQLFYGPNKLPGANFSGFDNPVFNAAFAKAQTLQPSPQRAALLQVMTDTLSRECVTLSGMTRQSVYLSQPGIVGLPDTGPVNGVMLRFVHKAL